MDLIGNLFQGALWLLCVGALALIVLVAIVVGAIRRGSGRAVDMARSDESGRYREGDAPVIEAITPRTNEVGRYQGGDVRTTTETTTTMTGDGGTTAVRKDEIDDRPL